jgi:hypothetical protein
MLFINSHDVFVLLYHVVAYTLLNKNKYQGKRERCTLTHQNCSLEELTSRLKSRNACYLSAQNLLSFILPSKNIKIKIE